jgi:K+-transporting ATPase KdpF subunit
MLWGRHGGFFVGSFYRIAVSGTWLTSKRFGETMSSSLVGLVLAILLAGYLVVALLFPERF